jgi:hypothetical protein
MPRPTYKTLPDELLEYAEPILIHFRNRGYRVTAELNKLGFPYTPTFVCRRGKHTTIIIELDNRIRTERLEDWVRFCHSSGRDTRLALCVPHSANLAGHDEGPLRQKGIGLYAVLADWSLVERIAPVDLALNVSLPELTTLPVSVRELLGSAYDQFDRGEWRGGFEEACQVFETEVRRYLKKWSRTGRTRVLTRRGPATLSDRKINTMTMGGLAKTFGQIQAPNHVDSRIEQALKIINRDRIGVVHHRSRATTEKRLRANVGSHMWVIVSALKLLND